MVFCARGIHYSLTMAALVVSLKVSSADFFKDSSKLFNGLALFVLDTTAYKPYGMHLPYVRYSLQCGPPEVVSQLQF